MASSGSNIPVSSVFTRLTEAAPHHRFISMEGSSRSTKTYSILQYLILRCLNARRPLRIGIVRARLTWLRATLLEDFRDIARDHFGIWSEDNFNRNDMVYWINGSQIRFIGLESDAGRMKAHGMKTDILFFNECTEVEYPAVAQLLQRCTFRGPVIFDFNPNCGEEFWLFKKILTRRGAVTIHSTYKDNPFLGRDTVEMIESFEPTPENIERGTADETHWKIYGLGVRTIVKGLVFPSFTCVPELPNEFDDRCGGLDFGFSNDPTTLVGVLKLNGALYFDEQLYKRKLTSIINPDYPEQQSMQGEFQKIKVTKRLKIWADGARPEVIKDLCNCGYNVKACKKGPGSIVNGIQVMNRYPLNITERSINMIKEVRNYKWKIDKNGEPTNEPVDNFNDCMDAARYGVVGQFSGFGGGGTPRYETDKMRTGAEKYDAFG